MTVPAAPAPREPRGPSDAGAPVDPTLPTTHPVRRTLRFGAGPEWSLSQLGAAAAGMGGVALYLAGLSVAAGGFDAIWWALVLVPLLTLSWAGSAAPLALWALLLLGWFVLTPAGSFSWWSLPAALGAVSAHAAAALAASSPPAGSFTRRTVRRWVRHAAVAAAAAVPVALLAGALSARPLGLVPAAYVLGLGGVAVGLWLLRTSPPTTPG